MALYVALCYYDRDQPWDGVPDKESTPEYTEFARRATEAGVMRGGEALHPVTMSTTITVSGGNGDGAEVESERWSRTSQGWVAAAGSGRSGSGRCGPGDGPEVPLSPSAAPRRE